MKKRKRNLSYLLAAGLLPFGGAMEAHAASESVISQPMTAEIRSLPESSYGVDKFGFNSDGLGSVTERNAAIISVEEARQKIEQNDATVLAQTYTLEGVVTSDARYGKYLQDDRGGILLYLSNKNLTVTQNHRYQVTGKLSNYKGQYQIQVSELKDLGAEQALPKEISVEDVVNYPDRLITVKGNWKFIKDKTGKNYIFQFQGEDGKYLDIKDLRLKQDFSFNPTTVVTSITGIASSFKGAPQINVKDKQDVIFTQAEENYTALPISKIQGNTHLSPLEGKEVQTRGIVTAISNDYYNQGFYITSLKEDRDDDETTSEGLYINAGKNLPKGLGIGSKVTVKGIVKEQKFNQWDNQLPNTTLEMKGIEVASDRPVDVEEYITPVSIGNIPNVVYHGSLSAQNLATTPLKPKENALDYYESLEGMLVSVRQPKVVMSKEANSDIFILPDKGEGADVIWTPNGGVKYTYEKQNPQVLVLTDSSWTKNKKWKGDFNPQVGDYFDGNAIGVMGFNFNRYRIFPMGRPLPSLVKGNLQRGTAKYSRDEDHLYFATYNVENFSAKDKERGEKIAQQIANELCAPDIIGLIEIQDNDGQPAKNETDSGIVAANETLQLLTDRLREKGYDYEAVNIDPRQGNQDGGAPGGNIRPAFLYRKDRVKLTENTPGPNNVTDTYEKGKLTYNPGVLGLEAGNDTFADSRKPLVAEFEMISGKYTGEKFLFIGNHFNSKGGDEPIFGPNEPPVRKSEVQRTKQAQYIANFVQEVQRQNANAKIVCLGDLNDFEFSSALAPLKSVMRDVIDILPEQERYTYQYEGNSQTLDHIFFTENMAKFVGVEDVSPVHINAEFTEKLGRVSDHDPLLVRVKWEKEEAPVPTPTPKPEVQPLPNPLPLPITQKEEDNEGYMIDFSRLPAPKKDNLTVENQEKRQASEFTWKEVSGYVSGYPDGTFRPDTKITRGETAAILSRLIENKPAGHAPFSDVNATDWYAKYIEQLAALGILSGYPDGTFRPQKAITRAEFVTLVGKLLKVEKEKASVNVFTDLDNCWAKETIEGLAHRGILHGDGQGHFHPNQFITRAEVVTILNQIVKLSSKEEETTCKDIEGHWAEADIRKALISTTDKN